MMLLEMLLDPPYDATRATLVEATADIGELIERCSKFEDNLSSHINKCGDVSNLLNEEFSSASTIINEIEDRKKRENNLIILNVPEQIKNDKVKLTRDYDLKKVKLALGKITNLDTRFNLKNIKRIGKFNADKIRPICVKCDSRYDVTRIVTHWRLVPKYFIVSYDLTKNQREDFNKLRNEAKIFNSLEENKDKGKQIVKFTNGNPMIVTVKAFKSKDKSSHDSTSINNPKNLQSQRSKIPT